MAKNAVYGLRG